MYITFCGHTSTHYENTHITATQNKNWTLNYFSEWIQKFLEFFNTSENLNTRPLARKQVDFLAD